MSAVRRLAGAAAGRAARALLREVGVESVESELEQGGYVASGMLTTGTKPFNVFARLVSGAMAQPEMAAANALLDGPAAERFLLACNRKENDEHWHSSAPEWLGKAAMSQRHRFLLLRDLDWSWFNALVFGMRDGAQLAEAVATLEAMREAALSYTRADGGWSTSVGLYLHCYPLNSVQALHLHIVDLAAVGPRYKHLSHKNLSLDAVLTVLREGSISRDLRRRSGRSRCCSDAPPAPSTSSLHARRSSPASSPPVAAPAERARPLLVPPAAQLRSVLRAVWRFLAAADGQTQHSSPPRSGYVCELAPAPAAQVLSYALRAADARAAARAADRTAGADDGVALAAELSRFSLLWRAAQLSDAAAAAAAAAAPSSTCTTQPTAPTPPTAPPLAATRCEPASVDSDGACARYLTVPTPPPILRAPTASPPARRRRRQSAESRRSRACHATRPRRSPAPAATVRAASQRWLCHASAQPQTLLTPLLALLLAPAAAPPPPGVRS